MKTQSPFFAELLTLFSAQRISTYLNHPACRDEIDALAAYSWNMQLSQAFYPSLQTLEVTLRNAMHTAISQKYHSECWFESKILHFREQKTIEETKKGISNQNKHCDANRIIAELRFGFWTSLFDVRYEHNQILWPHLLQRVFPYAPRKYRTRHHLSKQINQIRLLRNRIFHYEPIWHWQNLLDQHDSLYNLIQWISPQAYSYSVIHDQFKEIYNQRWKLSRELIIEKFQNLDLVTT
jgi:hypothetical protein